MTALQGMTAGMDGNFTSRPQPIQTLILLCPVCGSDAGDTLGVTGPMWAPHHATVVMQCDVCGTAYFSPALLALEDSAPAALVSPRRLRHLMRKRAADSRILQIDGLAHIPDFGSYDLILISRALETAVEPNALLARVCRLLSDEGRAVVVTGNAASSCFAVFGGRHWTGYQLSGVRQQLTPKGLRRLSANAGLRVERLQSRFASRAWLQSMVNWLRDWGASRVLLVLLTGHWLVPQLLAALLESLAVARGRGALLVTELSRSR